MKRTVMAALGVCLSLWLTPMTSFGAGPSVALARAGERLDCSVNAEGKVILAVKGKAMLAVTPPAVEGIWETKNQGIDKMSLSGRKNSDDGAPERVELRYSSAKYGLDAVVVYLSDEDFVRQQIEFINAENVKKGVRVKFSVELFPGQKVTADKWFNVSAPYHLPYPEDEDYAIFGVPQLAYGDLTHEARCWSWGVPIVGFCNQEETTGIFLINSPYHPWTQHVTKGGKNFEYMRAIGLAAQKGYSTHVEEELLGTDVLGADVYPIETILGVYGGNWRDILKNYYLAFPGLYRKNRGTLKGGLDGRWEPLLEDEAIDSANAGFKTYVLTDEVWYLDTGKQVMPEHRPPIAMYNRYFDDVMIYIMINNSMPDYSFYYGLNLDDFKDAWRKGADGKVIVSPAGNYAMNPDPGLSWLPYVIESVKKLQKEYSFRSIYIDGTDAYVDEATPTEAYPFKVLYKEVLRAGKKLREEFPNAVFYNFGGGGQWYRYAWEKYIDLDIGGTEHSYGEGVSRTAHDDYRFLAEKVAAVNMSYCIHPATTGEVGLTTDIINKETLFWGFSLAAPLHKAAYREMPDRKPVLDAFARNIPVATKLNSMNILWDAEVVRTGKNVPFNVFAGEKRELFAVSLENPGDSKLVTGVAIDREKLGIQGDSMYVLGRWDYKREQSGFKLLKGEKWVYGEKIKTVTMELEPRSVSVLWIARYDGRNPINFGFGFADPVNDWYTGYVTCRTDDATVEEVLSGQLIEDPEHPEHGYSQVPTTVITLPSQKVQRELKFSRWDGTPIKVARTRQKVGIRSYKQR